MVISMMKQFKQSYTIGRYCRIIIILYKVRQLIVVNKPWT